MVRGAPATRPGEQRAKDSLSAITLAQSEMLEAIARVGGAGSEHGQRLLPKLILLSQEVGRAQQDLYWALTEGRP